MNDYKSRLATVESNLQDAEAKGHKSSADSSSLNKQLEEIEHKLGLSKKENKNLDSQLQEARQQAEDESKVGRIGNKMVPFLYNNNISY